MTSMVNFRASCMGSGWPCRVKGHKVNTENRYAKYFVHLCDSDLTLLSLIASFSLHRELWKYATYGKEDADVCYLTFLKLWVWIVPRQHLLQITLSSVAKTTLTASPYFCCSSDCLPMCNWNSKNNSMAHGTEHAGSKFYTFPCIVCETCDVWLPLTHVIALK